MMQSNSRVKMRSIVHLDLILLPLLVIVFSTCMDLTEFEPEGPPQKADPPEGPSVILPVQDAIFYCEQSYSVTLDWTAVNGALAYEFQVSTDSSFTGSFPVQRQFPPTSYSVPLLSPVTTYYFRVRAYSDLWTWYTDWSDVRRFYLMPVLSIYRD